MANLLFLVHRLPYPPNKGDKVRSYHLLKHLAAQHRVFLGTFVDDPDDLKHLATVRSSCADMYVGRIHPKWTRLRSLTGLLRGESLTEAYYRHAGLRNWVQQIRIENLIDQTIVFSSAMAQYAPAGILMLVDFVDVDSLKWTQYASAHRWPLNWLYRREGVRLLAFERAVSAKAQRSFFVTPTETELFRSLAPECADTVEALGNGVDAAFFAPDPQRASPFAGAELPLVFTGAMDYWPNIDAVTWFVSDILPQLRRAWPQLQFHIVGRNPAPAVLALACDHVKVTGTVADVRPYLQHAAAVVAPLRLARGIQNKILEAMAMERPVVTTTPCANAIGAVPDVELVAAADPAGFVNRLNDLLESPQQAGLIGRAARKCVLRNFSWDAQLTGIERFIVSRQVIA
jgi:sugar transferase (PEP-CTERM/EpsH1 system associated)